MVRGAHSQAPRRVAGMPSPSPPQPSGARSGQPGGTAGRDEEGRAALDPEQRVRQASSEGAAKVLSEREAAPALCPSLPCATLVTGPQTPTPGSTRVALNGPGDSPSERVSRENKQHLSVSRQPLNNDAFSNITKQRLHISNTTGKHITPNTLS